MSDPPLRGLIRPTIRAASMRRASQVGSKAEGLEPTCIDVWMSDPPLRGLIRPAIHHDPRTPTFIAL
jgi:hypothetical protein